MGSNSGCNGIPLSREEEGTWPVSTKQSGIMLLPEMISLLIVFLHSMTSAFATSIILGLELQLMSHPPNPPLQSVSAILLHMIVRFAIISILGNALLISVIFAMSVSPVEALITSLTALSSVRRQIEVSHYQVSLYISSSKTKSLKNLRPCLFISAKLHI